MIAVAKDAEKFARFDLLISEASPTCHFVIDRIDDGFECFLTLFERSADITADISHNI